MGCPYEVTFYSPGKTVRFKSNDANNTFSFALKCNVKSSVSDTTTKQNKKKEINNSIPGVS